MENKFEEVSKMATKTKNGNGSKKSNKATTIKQLIFDLAKNKINDEEFQTALKKHYKETKPDKSAEWIDAHIKGYKREAASRKRTKNYQ